MRVGVRVGDRVGDRVVGVRVGDRVGDRVGMRVGGGGATLPLQIAKPERVRLRSENQVMVLPAATATFTGPVVPLYARPLTVSLSK
jgi:hypothetical protein